MKLLVSGLVVSQFFNLLNGLNITVDPPYNPIWVLEGTSFRASCSAEGPEASDLEWLVDGSRPSRQSGYDESRTAVPVGGGRVRTTVTISKSKMGWDFSPSILCRSVSAGKDVLVGVSVFAAYIKNANISEENDVSIECRPDTAPEVSAVSWSRDGVLLSNDTGGRILLENNTQLVIQKSTPADAGVYTCNMALQAGPKGAQTFMHPVTLSGKPYFSEKISSEVQVYINDSLVLTCPVGGYPTPEVYWLHDGDTPVNPSDRVTFSRVKDVAGARLTIRNLTAGDLGQYRCAAENAVGRLVKEFHVVLAGSAVTSTGVYVTSLIFGLFLAAWGMHVK